MPLRHGIALIPLTHQPRRTKMNTTNETEALVALPEIRELEPAEINEVAGGTVCVGYWHGKSFIGICWN